MFWENFVSLCADKGVAPNTVAAELSLSSGSVTAWKNGTVPRETTLRKIANYFNVSVDYLIGFKQKENPTVSGEVKVTDEDMRHLAAFHNADEDTKRAIKLLLAKFERGEGVN